MILAGVLVAPAQAQEGCKSPGGDAALDQYCESVPGATGDRGNAPGAGDALEGSIEETRGDRGTARDRPVPQARNDERPSADVPGALGSAIEPGSSGDNAWLIALTAGLIAGTAALAWAWRRRGSPDA